MAVKIRLKQVGKKHQRSYWIVAIDSKAKRDGKFLEKLGFYDPNFDPPKFKIDKKRFEYWLGVGAQPSETVRKLTLSERSNLSKGSTS
ncbi:30S ribosomal protein S16 [Candidatus Microgenomates bacterium]|nr:30S ribosomal protein S16 [Candidatus Microgenomates bacterium]